MCLFVRWINSGVCIGIQLGLGRKKGRNRRVGCSLHNQQVIQDGYENTPPHSQWLGPEHQQVNGAIPFGDSLFVAQIRIVQKAGNGGNRNGSCRHNDVRTELSVHCRESLLQPNKAKKIRVRYV